MSWNFVKTLVPDDNSSDDVFETVRIINRVNEL